MNSVTALSVDMAVVAAYFILVVVVGLRFSQKDNSLESFTLGNRSMPWWAVLASIIAAETSAATFLGTPAEAYSLVSYTYLQMVLGTILGRIIVAFLFLKPFFDLRVFSIYEFLEVRFGRGTRALASILFLITRVLASGARLYVAAIILAVAFTLVTGVRPDNNQQLVIYVGAIVAITVVTAVYTSIGGIKAVIFTDCIQSTVMFLSALGAIAALIVQIPGGLPAVVGFFKQTNIPFIESGIIQGASPQANLVSILTSDYTIWSAIFGMTFATLATHGTDQDMVQRMLTAPDYKKSRVSLVLSGLSDIPIGFIFLTIGILLHLYYQQNHDPLLPQKTNEVFAYFILKNMPVGLRALIVAGVFATAMGSLSAALNALATSFTRDWLDKTHGQDQGENAVKAVRLSTYAFAIAMIVVASATAYFVIVNPQSRIIPIALGIFGYTYGSLLGVFLLGLLTKTRGSDLGNYLAMASGFIAVIAATELFQVAYPWRIMIGALITFIVGFSFPDNRKAALFQD